MATAADRNENIKTGALIAGIYIGYQYILKPLLETLNLKESAEEKRAKEVQQSQLKEGIWTPQYVDKLLANIPKGYVLKILTYSDSKKLAENINDAFGGILNDNESQIYAQFRALSYWSQLSQVVKRYRELYNEDLLGELQSRLSDSEMIVIYDIVNRLTPGYVKQ